MNAHSTAQAVTAAHDAVAGLDRCDRDGCGAPADTRSTRDSFAGSGDHPCSAHSTEPTHLRAEALGAYWDHIASGFTADEALLAAHAVAEQWRAQEQRNTTYGWGSATSAATGWADGDV